MSSGRAMRTQEREGIKFAQLNGRISVLPLLSLAMAALLTTYVRVTLPYQAPLSPAPFVSTVHVRDPS